MLGWKRMVVAITALSSLFVIHGAQGKTPVTVSAEAPDWAAMIECRTPASEYLDFVMGDFQQARYKARLKIKRIAQDNPFINEYELPVLITAYGYDTRRIVFTSSGIMAVVDEQEPAQLAKRLGLDIAYQQGEKILASKLISKTQPEPYINDVMMWQEVARDLSTVDTHPGKTLVGCSYDIKTNEP